MQRVFFSFHVPESVATSLFKNLQQQVDFDLYPVKNLHITLQFVGETTDTQIEQLKTIGEEISEKYSAIKVAPTTFFVEQGRLRLAIEKEPLLLNIQRDLSSKIGAIEGIKLKDQNYVPHITLARTPENFSPSSMTIHPEEFTFTMGSFGFYKSDPGKDRMGNYTLLKEFQLNGAERKNNAIHAILLPARPQPDTIVAIFLLETFGQEQYPGIEKAEILVRPTPPEGATESSLLSQGILPIDIARGAFDHHIQSTTASQLVAKALNISQLPALAKLLAYAERDDKFGRGTVSQDPLDKAFGLSGLIAALNKTLPNNPGEVVSYITPLLTAHFLEEKKRTEDIPGEFEEKLASKKAQLFETRHKRKKVKIVAIESDEPSMAGWLRSTGGMKADTIIQKTSSGNTNILTQQFKKIDLRQVVSLVRSEELRANGKDNKLPTSLSTKPGRIEEVPEWYYDRATNSLLNGGVNPGDTPPTKIPFQVLIRIVLEGLKNTL